MTANIPGIELLEIVAERLDALLEEVVFLGGAATALFVTDPGAPQVRHTTDVDVIVETAARMDYYKLSEKLRQLGFHEAVEEGTPICRWRVGEVALDVMPTRGEVLGFSNRWYPDAFAKANRCKLPTGIIIKLVTPPHFLATKVEAFQSRGKGDFLLSHDMEDIVTIIDGRAEIVEEVKNCDPELKAFLTESVRSFLEKEAFLESISGHLPPDVASQRRASFVLDRLRSISS